MKRIVVGMFGCSVLIFAAMSACNTPVEPNRPSTLAGQYEGTYALLVTEGTATDSVVQAVWLVFTDSTYAMAADTGSSNYDPTACFCKASGTYTISDMVVLTPSDSVPIPDNCATCDAEDSPQGDYSFEQPEGNLRLIRIDTANSERITSMLILKEVVTK